MTITNRLASAMYFSIYMSVLVSCQKELNTEVLSIESSTIRSKNSTLSAKAALGRKIYFDNSFSSPAKTQSCSSCHLPAQGFVGKGDVAPSLTNAPNTPRGFLAGIAEGASSGAYGGRKPPSASYATFSPRFSFDGNDFSGGLFWDGRATGLTLGIPAAEQALGPFLAGVEQNLHTKEDVLSIISNPSNGYATLWRAAWGSDISVATTADVELNYNRVGFSIAEFEASSEVNQFSSKYDAYLNKKVDLTPTEKDGLSLFKGKAKCDKCHDASGDGKTPPLFTDFGYENIGLPSNTDFLGALNRPVVADMGLGGFLLSSTNPLWRSKAAENMGKFRTPTLRNVAKGESNKRYMHNGVLKSLEEVVHFYNTRDTDSRWGNPEVPMNMETGDVGDLKLSLKEELAIVAFLRTLSDGWSATSSASTARVL